jgi:hypothetical protein
MFVGHQNTPGGTLTSLVADQVVDVVVAPNEVGYFAMQRQNLEIRADIHCTIRKAFHEFLFVHV